ncbi:AraC family transcriptional regulator [Herbaspirillum robiniae]|uniref:AraC family transcriptional regulator n=1 Tax=Herbaspirillum robiniae TaxID=2014887 RepID=A0A246WR72_9BURK|nr:AraC family transcriptional regulator [Herbaspirillum robiniae]OWY28901.1 AraC family transcriptional regulator [Herbaspirillum robiniae]
MTSKASAQASRAEYTRRMNRVLNYIDAHLEQPLDGAELADVANFSRFHFHRIFAALMDETLGSYIRRRRLEKAAFRLSCGQDETVLETALATGFGSAEAFARAFKLRFGCTPSQWRADTPRRMAQQAAALDLRPSGQKSNPDQVFGNLDQASQVASAEDDVSYRATKGTAMEVRIIELPAARVAYQRLIGPYGPAIGAFWRNRIAPWMQSHGLSDATCYGIAYHDPSVTPASKCQYDACVEVAEDFPGSEKTDHQVLPGGRYAVAHFKGKPETIAAAWTWLTREWLPSSGLQCDDRPCFEMFSAAMARDPETGEPSCDICIPVRAL